MGYAVKIYEAFKEDEIKAKLLAEFIELVEQAILNNQLATRQDVTISELKLTKEIEQVRADLSIEIEKIRTDLSIKIEKIRTDLTKEIHQSHANTLRWMIGLFFTAVLTQAGLIIALLQLAINK